MQCNIGTNRKDVKGLERLAGKSDHIHPRVGTRVVPGFVTTVRECPGAKSHPLPRVRGAARTRRGNGVGIARNRDRLAP